jgi:hypothetical protein
MSGSAMSGRADGRSAGGAHADVRPLLTRGRLVTVDGHPICAECGTAVAPAGAGRWRHVPPGRPYPLRSRWFAPVTWSELRKLRTYREFTARYPWTVRPELCGGAVTAEADWLEGARRLREYHAMLAAVRRERARPGKNPLLDLVRVLAGGRDLAWSVPGGDLAWSVPGGLGNVLDLPSRRRELAALFAWAIPGDGALAVLARYGPLLECGAGTGYWAALLRARGADIVACDLAPGHKPWTPVRRADSITAVRRHRDRALFLCWPPHDGLVVYRRNPVRRPLAQRDRCASCRRFVPTGSAGRCDWCFARRPPAMALRAGGLRVEYPQEVVDAMPRGLRLAFERSPSVTWPAPGPRPAGSQDASGPGGFQRRRGGAAGRAACRRETPRSVMRKEGA